MPIAQDFIEVGKPFFEYGSLGIALFAIVVVIWTGFKIISGEQSRNRLESEMQVSLVKLAADANDNYKRAIDAYEQNAITTRQAFEQLSQTLTTFHGSINSNMSEHVNALHALSDTIIHNPTLEQILERVKILECTMAKFQTMPIHFVGEKGETLATIDVEVSITDGQERLTAVVHEDQLSLFV